MVCRPGKGVLFEKVQEESDRSLERPEYRRNHVKQMFSVLLILDTSLQNIHFRLVHALHTNLKLISLKLIRQFQVHYVKYKEDKI